MKSLYEQLDYLPEWAIPPVVAMLCIIIGYFLAKVLAGVVVSLFPNNRDTNDQKIKPRAKINAKFIFWITWLFFIILGLSQFPLISVQFSEWNFSKSNIESLSIISGLTMLGVLCHSQLIDLISSLKIKLGVIPKPLIIGFVIIFFASFFFIQDGNLLPRMSVSIFIINIAFLLGKVIQQAVVSSFEVLGVDEMLLNKTSLITMYFVLSTFLLPVFRMWT